MTSAETPVAPSADVAVVVAAYEPGGYLRDTLDSVLAQTVQNWECVVVDDGSVQDLGWVAAIDRRIRLVRQSNSGVSVARNTGAALTTAPVLAFLDQDDLWRPQYLEAQLSQFGDPGVVLASTDFDIVDSLSRRVGPGFAGHNRSYEDLLTGCGLHCGAVAVRRTAFDLAAGFRPYAVSQDWDLWLRILRTGGAAARTDDVLASWRRHDGNASGDYRTLLRDGRTLLAEHSNPAARVGERHVRHLSGVQAFDAARTAGPTRNGLAHLAWALAHAPRYTLGSLVRYASRR